MSDFFGSPSFRSGERKGLGDGERPATAFATLLLLIALFLLAGCGGHGGGRAVSTTASTAAGKGKGRATIRIQWPSRTGRLIPNAANSIVVALSSGGKVVVSKVLARPTDGSASTTATLTGLAYGAYTVAVDAYPTATGTGTAQAAGAGTLTVTEETPGTVAVAMDSTVASLAVVPGAGTIGLSQTVGVTASARDASGAIVLLAVGDAQEILAWTATPAGSVTVAGTGPLVSVTSLLAGPVTLGATLKVKDDGTTLSASAVLNVSAAADYRLAVGGYPKTGGDPGNTGQGGGSGAAGTVGWTAPVGTAAVGAVVVDANSTVFAGSGGLVTAVSKNGTPLWQASVAGTVNGLLLTRGGGVIVSAAKLTSLNGGGTVDWTFPDDFGASLGSGEVCYAPNVLSDGSVVEATSAKVVTLDPYARTVRWAVPFASSSGAAVGSDDTVVVWNSGEVRGLAGASGAQAFSQPKAATVDPPVPASNATWGKNYPVSGSFGFSAPPSVLGHVVAWPESAYVGTATGTSGGSGFHFGFYFAYSLTETSYLRVLSGGSVSSKTLASAPNDSPYNPNVPVPTATGADASGRSLLTYSWRTTWKITSTQGWSVPTYRSAGTSIGPDGVVYFVTKDAPGVVKALDPTTGMVRWTATLPTTGTGAQPAIGPDGSLYAGTADGRVVQIR